MTRCLLSKLVTPRRHFDPGMGPLACVASLRERIVRRIYDLCGRGPHYWLVMALAQGAASVVVASSNVLLAASFFDPPGWKIMVALTTEAAFTVTAVVLLTAEVRPRLERFRRWYDAGSPDPADTIEVWSLVVNGSAETYRRWAARTRRLGMR